jgi:Holliday junction resolvase
MKAKRTDANQTEIVQAFRDIGCSVFILSAVGKGCPDILVGYRKFNFLFEIKDGKKSKSARKLTECEDKFIEAWKGQVAIINSVDDAIHFITRVNKNLS